jgi:hypothetical protein
VPLAAQLVECADPEERDTLGFTQPDQPALRRIQLDDQLAGNVLFAVLGSDDRTAVVRIRESQHDQSGNDKQDSHTHLFASRQLF